ncbi:MAG: sulfatase-like hydrolase/transferase [Candidatus Cyclobacteriaceae bacterium M2_1C_046]
MKKIFLFITCTLFFGCQQNEVLFEVIPASDYTTENVIIVVIDGPRYQETWGDNLRQNIPVQSQLAGEGILFKNFFNEGETYTLAGHTAITTGFYQKIENNGTELPANLSIFQSYLSYTQLPPDEAWLVTSKEKLSILADTKDLKWRGSFSPSMDAENREDSITIKVALQVLNEQQPSLAMIHLKGPDQYGHRNDWVNYIRSINETDGYVGDVWNLIQSHPHYADKTTLLITNDHGRHLDGISTGFEDHGDKCEGCKKISLLALGPDFEKGIVVDTPYEQSDIAPTVAKLLNFPFVSEGFAIEELVNK